MLRMHYTCNEVKVLLTSLLTVIIGSLKIEIFSILKEKYNFSTWVSDENFVMIVLH